MSKVVDTVTGKAAREDAAKQMAVAEEATKKQQQQENLRLAEAEGDAAERKATAVGSRTRGRRSLIATSNRGTNLGGTA